MQLFRMDQVETLDTSSYTMVNNLKRYVKLKVVLVITLKHIGKVHQRANFPLIDNNWAPESAIVV